MKWKDLRIGAKISASSGVILVLLVAVSAWAILGMGGVVADGMTVSAGTALRGELLQREVDHLNWASGVSAFLTTNGEKELTVGLDPTACAFGKWYYGEGRKAAEHLLPALAEPLRAIEAPHKHLHESAVEIKQAFVHADPNLPAFLTKKELDHVAWTSKVQDAILGHHKAAGVELDPTKCSFGKFLYGEAGQKIAASDPIMAKFMEVVEASHKRLHAHGGEIDVALAQEDVAAASRIYEEDVSPELTSVRGTLSEMQEHAAAALDGKRRAEAIFSTTTQDSLKQVQALLGQMTATAKANIMSEDEMISGAETTRFGIILLSIFAGVLGFAVAFFVIRAITLPLRAMASAAKRLAVGDIDQEITYTSKDEAGQLAAALREVTDSTRAMAHAAIAWPPATSASRSTCAATRTCSARSSPA